MAPTIKNVEDTNVIVAPTKTIVAPTKNIVGPTNRRYPTKLVFIRQTYPFDVRKRTKRWKPTFYNLEHIILVLISVGYIYFVGYLRTYISQYYIVGNRRIEVSNVE